LLENPIALNILNNFHPKQINRRVIFFLVAFSTMVSLVACGVESAQYGPKNITGSDVDQRFREFYSFLGGLDVLGPAISPKFSHDGKEYQYTAAVLMVYDPSSIDSQRYTIAALGVELGVTEAPTNPDAPNGHKIYQGFSGMYDRLGGNRFVGLPLTEVRYNPEHERVEQYFENMGFYQLENDPDNQVHLLDYGSWKCAVACGYESPTESQILIKQTVGSPFSAAIDRLDPSFTGFPLTNPYNSQGGRLEQIFENIVVESDPNSPGGIRLRPILASLGIQGEPDVNHEIPDFFMEYLNLNSGLEFSGKPISEFGQLSQDVYRQCFTNLCLDYFPNSSDGTGVRPVALGYTYKNLFYQSGGGADGSGLVDQVVTLKVWERHPLIANNQIQSIGLVVSNGDNPLENVEAVLMLSIPGIGDISYTFPATGADGTTSLELSPISVPNGTRIDYQVCVTNMNETFCVQDDFMIWGSP
jgi:hypothetical protein